MKKAKRIFSGIAAIAMLIGSTILPANSITVTASTQGDNVRNLAGLK